MLSKTVVSVSVIGLVLWCGVSGARAAADDETALIEALGAAQATLADGLAVGETVGKPISAKFEVEDGRLQLSVYVLADDGYKEVIVSPATGILMSAQKITDASDLVAAEAQTQVIKKTTVPLRTAVDRASSDAKASQIVSVIPESQDSQPLAKVAVLKAGQLTTVSEDLK